MIVYRELSSLEKDLGVSARMLYSLSNRRGDHYRKVQLPKGNGEFRELTVPDVFLKAVQRKIARQLLAFAPVSPHALAYRFGGSPVKNAACHVGKPMLLKLDIRHFFANINYSMVKKYAFPAEKFSEANRILLSLLCVHRDMLPQGAPTSPAISNLIMKDFDDAVGKWCKQRRIIYTRYCDDMTFSGNFDPRAVKNFVKEQLCTMGFFLNEKKTVFVRQGQKQLVTGVVVNQKANVAADYRRKLRQELYYCKTYGVASHMGHCGIPGSEESYRKMLLGRVNFALSIDPNNREMWEAKAFLLQGLGKSEK